MGKPHRFQHRLQLGDRLAMPPGGRDVDDLIRPRQQRRRDCRPERLGGLEVDRQLVTRVAGAVYATTSSGD